MHPSVATNDPAAVEREVQAVYLAMFPQGDRSFVPRAFGWAGDFFLGRQPGYQAVDAKYHDFEHTLQGTLCLARLLHGRQRAAAAPPLPQKSFELGLLAILMHDSGYLKRQGDAEGTGAKYTVTHVRRGADFAAEFLGKMGFSRDDILAVQNMIFCTGVNAPLERIPFQSEEEKITGFALASADLLGQMAADDYVEKLPVLFSEFEEAWRHDPGRTGTTSAFSSAEELAQKTPAFWEECVLPKLERDFRGLHRFLSDPYPDGPNGYLARIEANIGRLRGQAVSVQR